MKQAKQKVEPLQYDTYLAVIRNSVGSNAYRNFYAKIDGKKKDIMRDGELSCAFFASSVLNLFKLAKHVHGTVDGTVRDLKDSGWKHSRDMKPGAVLVWEEKKSGGESHKHIGFYVGNNRAVSNSSEKGVPATHHFTFGGTRGKPERAITDIFWHSKLK